MNLARAPDPCLESIEQSVLGYSSAQYTLDLTHTWILAEV